MDKNEILIIFSGNSIYDRKKGEKQICKHVNLAMLYVTTLSMGSYNNKNTMFFVAT